MQADQRARIIAKASVFSIIGNALLAISKIAVGFLAGSLSVIADGIDSSTDAIISVVSLLASRIMAKPSDAEHPYGHARAETIATTILAFVIFFAGAQLALGTIRDLIAGEVRPLPQMYSVWVVVASILGKLFLAWNQFSLGKKAQSDLLVANGKNMRNDVLISAAVLVGLFFTFVAGLPIIDSIIALLVSLWIIKSAVGIFVEVNVELMDGTSDKLLYERLFEAVRTIEQASNPHRARIRRIGNLHTIELDIEVDGNLSVTAGHEIVQKVEQAIKERIEGIYDIMVHVEPRGCHEEGEQYGLREDTITDRTSP